MLCRSASMPNPFTAYVDVEDSAVLRVSFVESYRNPLLPGANAGRAVELMMALPVVWFTSIPLMYIYAVRYPANRNM